MNECSQIISVRTGHVLEGLSSSTTSSDAAPLCLCRHARRNQNFAVRFCSWIAMVHSKRRISNICKDSVWSWSWECTCHRANFIMAHLRRCMSCPVRLQRFQPATPWKYTNTGRGMQVIWQPYRKSTAKKSSWRIHATEWEHQSRRISNLYYNWNNHTIGCSSNINPKLFYSTCRNIDTNDFATKYPNCFLKYSL